VLFTHYKYVPNVKMVCFFVKWNRIVRHYFVFYIIETVQELAFKHVFNQKRPYLVNFKGFNVFNVCVNVYGINESEYIT
jgi:hypothetical protein